MREPIPSVLADQTKLTIMNSEFNNVCKLLISCYQHIVQSGFSAQSVKDEDFYRNNFVEQTDDLRFAFNLEHLLFDIETGVIDEHSKTIGRIDIKVSGTNAIHYSDRHLYYSFECKRLAKNRKNQDYVDAKAGIGRFVVEEKYAQGLPWAGMIGFIEEGNIEKVIDDISARLNRHAVTSLCAALAYNPIAPDFNYSYKTNHVTQKSSRLIEICHLFFDMTKVPTIN